MVQGVAQSLDRRGPTILQRVFGVSILGNCAVDDETSTVGIEAQHRE